MGLKYAMNVAVIGFIDCMFGFITFIYMNIQDYRHVRHGNPDEVLMSYFLGVFGFVKGLALCIPAAQVMVNARERALTARRASNCWFFLTILQFSGIIILLYYYIWPMEGDDIGSDVVLFIMRIGHILFLKGSLYYVYKFRRELCSLIPRSRTCCFCCPSCPWSLTSSKARTSAASCPESETAVEGGGNREEAYAE